jgi:2,3,4,5-tetrahydropyridine-2-carboxylate N-succinyltransferase
MEVLGAEGFGLASIAFDGTVLDTWFLAPRLIEPCDSTGTVRLSSEAAASVLGDLAANCVGRDDRRGVEIAAVRTRISSLLSAPIDAHDIYLRLHLLSHRVIQPHGADLSGIFDLLTNVAWTSIGPCPLDRVDHAKLHARRSGACFSVRAVDKIPRMMDYVIPSGVRIADANRVRLGAHLAPDTLVMQEGFCNFNAGTLGAATVEGRISSGVVVGDASDIGGGASIMGTRSGGGKHVVSIGKRCLLGANSGVGISLGDDCVVEAGLYVTAGTRVTAGDGQVVKALELSGRNGLLFRRNSLTGVVEALVQTKSWGKPFTGVLSTAGETACPA